MASCDQNIPCAYYVTITAQIHRTDTGIQIHTKAGSVSLYRVTLGAIGIASHSLGCTVMLLATLGTIATDSGMFPDIPRAARLLPTTCSQMSCLEQIALSAWILSDWPISQVPETEAHI